MTAAGRSVRLIELAQDTPDSFTIGGKASGLARLASAGLPVPPAVVIPAETRDEDVASLAAEVAARFPGSTLAVRSSGIAEDLAQASYAGQYETVLGVPAEAGSIAEAVLRVRASAHGDTAASYAGRHKTAMAVLVMPMVDAHSAGIAFTRDPITGKRVVIVEAVEGLADRLAAGEQVGERWRIEERAERLNDLGVLTEAEAQEVADLARRCEAATGHPQDVEWAIADGRVLLLQARPITALDEVEPIPMDDEAPPGPWAWDSTHNRVPMTPLTISAFTEGFERGSRRLVETYGLPIRGLAMRSINGYIYIQVVPPAGKPGAPSPPKPVMRTLFHLVPFLRQCRRTARRAMEERIDRRLLEEWRTEVGPRIDATTERWADLDLSRLSAGELEVLVRDAVALEHEVFGWNMVTDPAYLFPLSNLHDFVQTKLGKGMEITTQLLAGASPSAYRESLSVLAGMLSPDAREATVTGNGDPAPIETVDPEFAAAHRVHLKRHGLRILGLDLSAKTVQEQPDLELSRLATLPPQEDPTPEARRLAAELRSSLDPVTAARFDELVAEARSTYPIREEGEAVHAKALGILRLVALEVGRRMVAAGHLEDREHVVFLTVDEVSEWLESPSDQKALVRTRRGEHLWARGRSPEPYLGGEEAMPDLDMFPPEVQRVMKVMSLVMAHDARPADLADGVDGVAASPGVHTGPARIVRGTEDFGKVQPGDVLVAPITTSPWEVLFPHIGALVTEGGGLLSHPAIVAREYALPAVVGCEGAMNRFHDGQILTVDGTAGTVTPMEESWPRRGKRDRPRTTE